MFSLSSTPLDPDELKRAMARPEAGACVTFEGWVRNRNEGRTVNRLEYEAYDAVAVKEGERILREARDRFGISDARCVHRVGDLAVGELAVWVGVAAAHRDEAYRASRYVIDEIKSRVPIWKKEHYVDGDSGWVNCERCAHGSHAVSEIPPPSFTESDYYARQTRLPEVGEAGQAKLRASKVLVVGSGGLGSPVLSYLAAAGVGTLGICEGDLLEASNLHRQTLYRCADVGEPKAALAARRIRKQNAFIEVHTHETPMTPGNVLEIFAPYDLILDCTDNFATKFLINDAAVLSKKPVVFASIYQYEGQLMFVRPDSGGACLRCLWPEVPEPGCVGSCAEVGVLGAVPGILGTMQAMEAIKYILGLPDGLGSEMEIFNCLTYASQRIKVPKQQACPVCGATPRIRTIDRDEYLPPADILVDVLALAPERLGQYRIIDIRELDEVQARPLPLNGIRHEHIAMSAWDPKRPPVRVDDLCLLCCARGMRSLKLAKQMRDLGCAKVYSVKGGWEAFHIRATR